MRTCNCPSCNANISIDDENRDFAFCQYCGSKIMLDDYRSTHRVVDEAKIKQAEIEREIRLKELNMKEAQMKQKNQLRKVLTYIWIASIFVVAGLCIFIWATNEHLGGMLAFCCLFYVGGPIVGGGAYLIFKWLPDRDEDKELILSGGIKLPKSIFPYSEVPFMTVENTLRSAGFTNITTVNMHDVVIGLIQKPNLVESITINGERVKSRNRVYLPTVPIVITYHGK